MALGFHKALRVIQGHVRSAGLTSVRVLKRPIGKPSRLPAEKRNAPEGGRGGQEKQGRSGVGRGLNSHTPGVEVSLCIDITHW